MLEIPRSVLREFRTVLRRAGVGSRRTQQNVVIFDADQTGLRIEAMNDLLAVQYEYPGRYSRQTLTLPIDAIDDLEGRGHEMVQLEANANGVAAQWQEGVVPHTMQYESPKPEAVRRAPASANRFTSLPTHFLDALHAGSQSAAKDRARYALDSILLRGQQGQVIATDGKQLLIQGGFQFPWTEDVLIPSVQVYNCRELREAESVGIGRTGESVSLQAGAWTLHLLILKDVRYPPVETILPKDSERCTSVQIDQDDVEFLKENLDRLPGGKDEHAPITVSCDGHLSIRAKGSDQPKPTVLIAGRSRVTGRSVQVTGNREYLGRALKLGLTELRVYSPDRPVVARDEKRIFLWMPVDKAVAIAESKDAVRISSSDAGPAEPPAPRILSEDSAPASNGRASRQEAAPSSNGRNGQAGSNGEQESELHKETKAATSDDLLAEINELKEVLRDAYTRTHRLAGAFKRHRKQAQIVKSTLASLRQLQHVEA